jgi:hypothetical protein
MLFVLLPCPSLLGCSLTVDFVLVVVGRIEMHRRWDMSRSPAALVVIVVVSVLVTGMVVSHASHDKCEKENNIYNFSV